MTFDFRRLPRAPQASPSNLRCAGLPVASLAAVAFFAVAAIPASAKEPTLSPTAREAEHFKTFDAAIAPVRGYDLSVDEAAKIRDCVKAIAARELTKALEIRGTIKDPVGLKLVNWYRLRGGYGQIGEYKAFLAENPAWPERGILNQRFEELLFSEGGNAASIKAHFKDAEPKNGIGFAAIASADLALGDTESAKARAVKVWRDMTIPPNYEQGFIERFGKFLTQADHKWRLDRLLIDDIRWAADRNERASAIRRQIARLPADAQKIAEARLAVFLHEDGAKLEIAKVLYDAKGDTGFLYHRIQTLRWDPLESTCRHASLSIL